MLRFFIHRPIFSSVIALITVLAGIICIVILPVAQFPQIVPPTVQVSATYNGADAETVAQTTTLPLELQINGAEDMIYMASSSTATGLSQITVTFAVGTDEDMAAVDVMNRVQQALPQLPESVQRTGISVTKQSTNMVLVVNLISPNGEYDSEFLTNYANIVVENPLTRVAGVGQVTVFGLLQYSMRIWVDPVKLTTLGLSTDDLANAVRGQNMQAAVGSTGASPTPTDPVFTLNLVTKGRLTTEEEFGDIIVRAGSDGAVVRLKDVARVELGSYQYFTESNLNGGATATLGIYQLPDANALQIAEAVRAEMERLKQYFPAGVEYEVIYDSTEFVKASLDELVKTLFEAGLLVLFVIFVFLQDWRATLIPMIAIPVSIIGTFAFMEAFGFSINTLTLLGLVLAIGLVVDDSIVVVENVYRQLEMGAPDSKTAAERAMKEVAGPIVATSLVLLAVFIPAAFMPGITGQLYNQFALTIAFSITLSSINSLTLSPALCGIFLKHAHKPTWKPFVVFNSKFDSFAQHYANLVRWLGHHWYLVVGSFAAAIVAIFLMLERTPTAFVPNEDQGWYMVGTQLPLGSSLDRTQAVSAQVLKAVREDPAVENVVEVNGYNMLTSVPQTDSAFIIVVLKPWDQRNPRTENIRAIIERVYPKLMVIPEAEVFPFAPPPIMGLGAVAGFQVQLEDINGAGFGVLSDASGNFLAELAKRPEITHLMSPFANDAPIINFQIDRTRAELLGVGISDVFDLLGDTLGQAFINNFNEFGQVYNVMIQADAAQRMTMRDALLMYVKNNRGEMVPLAAFCSAGLGAGTNNATHYNAYNTVQVNGSPAPGYSSGDAIKAVEQVAAQTLPDGIGYEWTGTTFQEIEAGGYAPIIFTLALVAVFLLLAAQYESWALPFNVLLAVAFAVLGALIALWMRHRALDTYAQIGLVMLVGLAAKNAILITEFAKKRRETGEPILDAAVNASHIRLRPILMTSFAFILGILPLAIAVGAGANSRQSIGTVVIGGMLGSTLMDQLVVPVLFVVIENTREWVSKRFGGGESATAPHSAPSGE